MLEFKFYMRRALQAKWAVNEQLEKPLLEQSLPLYLRASIYSILIVLGPGSRFADFRKHEALTSLTITKLL